MEDSALLQEYARTRSEPSFAALTDKYVGLVYSAALRQVGDPHLAEDVTQAVFIVLSRKAETLVRHQALSGWLLKATRYAAATQIRAAMRRSQREQEAYMQSTLNEPAHSTWEEIAPLLDEALASLGNSDRDVLALRYFENKTAEEIGRRLKLNEEAAQKRVSRALEKLRKFFTQRGVDSTTAAIAETISANSVHAAPALLAKTVTTVALTKGAAASISTLTLIKGALKIMAWTKTKTVIVASAAALLAIGTATVAVKTINAMRTTAALATMQGSWQGTLKAGPTQLRLVLKIFETNGAYRAVIDSIDQGAKNIPVARLSARPVSFHAELPALGADYRAVLKANGTEMSGTWKQLKRSFPLILKRTATPDTVAGTMAADEYAPRADSDLQGEWEGTLKAGHNALRLVLRISEPAPGTFHAQMDSVDQGTRNLPVTSLTYQKPTVHFVMEAINGAFEGNVNNRDDRMTGTWTQLGKKFPLTFQRVQANAQAATEAKPDYGNGAANQVQGHWKGALDAKGVKLHIVFHIALMPDGSYSATLDSPDQGAASIPATEALVNYPSVRLEWKSFGGVFLGRLENNKLTGTWRQGKVALPLQLERSTAK